MTNYTNEQIYDAAQWLVYNAGWHGKYSDKQLRIHKMKPAGSVVAFLEIQPVNSNAQLFHGEYDRGVLTVTRNKLTDAQKQHIMDTYTLKRADDLRGTCFKSGDSVWMVLYPTYTTDSEAFWTCIKIAKNKNDSFKRLLPRDAKFDFFSTVAVTNAKKVDNPRDQWISAELHDGLPMTPAKRFYFEMSSPCAGSVIYEVCDLNGKTYSARAITYSSTMPTSVHITASNLRDMYNAQQSSAGLPVKQKQAETKYVPELPITDLYLQDINNADDDDQPFDDRQLPINHR